MPKEEKTVSEELDSIDVKEDDDFFEKFLDDTNPDGDEDNAEKLDEKEPDSTDDTDTKDDLDDKLKLLAQLKEENEKLKKEAAGRLSDTVKSRQDRREMKDKLSKLESVVSDLLEKRKALTSDGEENTSKKPLEETKKHIEFGEDEKAYVDLKEVKDYLNEENKNIKTELDNLKKEQLETQIRTKFEEAVNDVVTLDKDKFAPAFEQLKTMSKTLQDRLIEIQDKSEDQSIKGKLSIDRGLDILDGTDEEKAFIKEFPKVDPALIARAFNSKRDLKRALTNISEATTEDTTTGHEGDEKILEKVKGKPSSLTRTENQSGGGGNLIERVSQLGTDDILSMSDKEIEKIEALLREEELRGDK